jgi:CRISPR/Cas system-associated protein Cas10 (large subunit of type III CRISPR-Cas system)
MNYSDIDMLQMDVDRLGQWTVENAMKNPGKSKALSFTRILVKNSLNYFLGTKEFRKRAAPHI